MGSHEEYLKQLRKPFVKLCRLRFLNPDGTIAFTLDNQERKKNPNQNIHDSCAFVSEGEITANLQNGIRRTAEVTIVNIDDAYSYNVNNLWFGTTIAIDEGLILDDGSEYYIPQGVFLITEPAEVYQSNNKTVTLHLVDKWAMLDGTLYGNLDATYEVSPDDTNNIFTPIQALLNEDKGNGYKVDSVKPIFTEYYNGKTQTLPDGTSVPLLKPPYTMTIDADGGTLAEVILGLCGMVNALVGYDASGALRVDASQDDIDDQTKPVIWDFSMDNDVSLLGLSYTNNNNEVINDYIVVGEQMDDNSQPSGRAQNLDGKSDTNINIIGRKLYRETASGYATDLQCKDKAVWELKRASVLQKSVSISCSQIMHIDVNKLVTIKRTDKVGSPVERHLVQGFTRTLAGNAEMTISAISVADYPNITTVLPSDYQQMNYLESTGTQYIDTGLMYKSGYRMVAKLRTNGMLGGVGSNFFSGKNNPFVFYSRILSNGGFSIGWDEQINLDMVGFGVDYEFDSYLSEEERVVRLNGEEVYRNTSHVVPTYGENRLRIFDYTVNGSHNSSYSHNGRCYYCRIYDEGNLVRDFVPAKRKSDNKLGMFDLVELKFYTNKGTGTFIAG